MPLITRYFPDDFPAMRDAIYMWASSVSGVQTVWKTQNTPAPAKPYVAMKFLTPFVPQGRASFVNVGRAVRVLTAVDSTVYTVTFSSIPISVNSGVGATVTSIRNQLITAIIAALPASTTYAIAPDMLNVELPEPISGSVAGTRLAYGVAEQTIRDAESTLQVDVYQDAQPTIGGPVTMDPSLYTSGRLESSLESENIREPLQTAGLAIVRTAAFRKPDVVQNAFWEDRAGFDVTLRCLNRFVNFVDFVDSATITGTLDGRVV